jgi:hypothetical protein
VIGVLPANGAAGGVELLLEGGEDEIGAARGSVAGLEEFLEFELGGGFGPFQDHVHDFGLAVGPGRFVADEIADDQRIVLARRAQADGVCFGGARELVGIDIGQAEEAVGPAPRRDHDDVGLVHALGAGVESPGGEAAGLEAWGGVSWRNRAASPASAAVTKAV